MPSQGNESIGHCERSDGTDRLAGRVTTFTGHAGPLCEALPR